MPRDYTKIRAWKLADELACYTYRVTKQFPREEMFGISSQLRRAASSIAANIAEGSCRAAKENFFNSYPLHQAPWLKSDIFCTCQRASDIWLKPTMKSSADWLKTPEKPLQD